MVSEKFAPEISLYSGLSAIPRGVPFSPYGTCCSVDFCSLCLYLKQKQGGGCSAIFMWYWIMLREKSFFCVKELRFYTTEQVGLYSFLSPFVNLFSFISTLWVSRNCHFYKICPCTQPLIQGWLLSENWANYYRTLPSTLPDHLRHLQYYSKKINSFPPQTKKFKLDFLDLQYPTSKIHN